MWEKMEVNVKDFTVFQLELLSQWATEQIRVLGYRRRCRHRAVHSRRGHHRY